VANTKQNNADEYIRCTVVVPILKEATALSTSPNFTSKKRNSVSGRLAMEIGAGVNLRIDIGTLMLELS
jgi:hypothetical protein